MRNLGKFVVSLSLLAGFPLAAMADRLPQSVLDRIDAAITEAEAASDSRSEAEQKLSSELLEMAGPEGAASRKPRTGTPDDATPKKVDCEITCEVTDRILALIGELGGETVFASKPYGSIHARLPLPAIKALSEDGAVTGISALHAPVLNKANTSQGYTAHSVDKVKTDFGLTGKGIKVGIISDSVRYLASIQKDGDLPNDVTVLTGVGGVQDYFVRNGGTGEGCGMLEIVYDLAPQAKLFFASGWGGTLTAFADAVDQLAAKGCNVIIDDVTCYKEYFYQDSPIMDSINAFVGKGGVYFSSAGNSGNLDTGNSGTWEGDFHGAGTTGNGGEYHSFTGKEGDYLLKVKSFGNNNGIAARIELQWSDPWKKSSNDYNLYLIAPNDTNPIKAKSTTTQNGNGEPYEEIEVPSNLYKASGNTFVPTTDLYLAVVKKSGAAARFMKIDTHRGRLQGGTDGSTYGHNAAERAITLAAAPPPSGTRAFAAGDPPETFSSDGPRKIFYDSKGNAYTPGNFLSSGGKTLNKPDATAADSTRSQWIYYATSGQSTSFGGTSAAAPHAGAIAALMLEANPNLNRDNIMDIFAKATFGTPGWNRTKGYGIIDAYTAVKLAKESSSSTIVVSPTAKSCPAYAQTNSFSVTANSSWTASASDSWIRLKTANGTGNGTVTYSVEANSATKERKGTITVQCGSARATHEVAQAAAAARLSISPSALDFGNAAGKGSFDVTANYSWTVSTSAGWISLDTTVGSGNGKVSYRVLENTDRKRTGTITVKSENGLEEKHTVTQAAMPQLEIAPEGREFGNGGGNGSFSVASDSMWTVSPSDQWIKTGSANGSGNGTVNYSVDPNDGARRTGYIQVKCGNVARTFTVNQLCGEVVVFSPESISVPAAGGAGTVTATILWNGSGSMEVSGETSGGGISWTSRRWEIADGYRYEFYYTALSNSTAGFLERQITVVLNGKTYACPIVQDPPSGMYRVTYRPGAYGTGNEIVLDKSGGSILVLKGATYKRDGYTQTGWSTSDGGPKDYGLLDSYLEGKSIVLYPYWEKNPTTYAVQFKPGQYGTGSAQTKQKTQGVALTLPGALFTRENYEQTGWSSSAAGTSKEYELGGQYTADSTATFYPYWTKPPASEPKFNVGFYRPEGWDQAMCLSKTNLDWGVYAPQSMFLPSRGLVLNYCVCNWSDGAATRVDSSITLWKPVDGKMELLRSELESDPTEIESCKYLFFCNRDLSSWLSSLTPGYYYLEINLDPYGKLNDPDVTDNSWGVWFVVPVQGMKFSEALDCDSIVFYSIGDASVCPHYDQTATNGTSVQFGPQLPNRSQDAVLWADVTGPGTLSFKWDAQSSTSDNAFMALWVDDDMTNWVWSAGDDWSEAIVDIGEGTHSLAWQFVTYDGSSAYLTAGRLDNAVWTPTGRQYPVTYKPGAGGAGREWTDSKLQGSDLALRGATFTRPGYTQTGWATNDGGAKAYNLLDAYSTDAAITLYPFWEPNAYNVSYALDGGTAGASQPLSAAYGTPFRVSAPTRAGFAFRGWKVTNGLDIASAKYGDSMSSQPTAIGNASQQCSNGTDGDVWFLNLASSQGADVALSATWEELSDDGTRDVAFYAPASKGWTFPLSLSSKPVEWLEYAPDTAFEQGSPVYLGYCAVNWNLKGSAMLQSTRLTFTDSSGKVVAEGESIQIHTLGVYQYHHFRNIPLDDYLEDLPPGKYKLTAEIDPNRLLDDPDRSNNSTSIWFTLVAETDPIPELPAGASPDTVAAALQDSADVRLAQNITDAATYAAYRAWAQSVKGVDGIKAAGKQTVKDSRRAWLSFALGLDSLATRNIVSDEVQIVSFHPVSGGAQYDFELAIAGLAIGASDAIAPDILKSNLKKVIEVEGAGVLDGSAFASQSAGIVFDSPSDGKARFSVAPSPGGGNAFFMRVRLK